MPALAPPLLRAAEQLCAQQRPVLGPRDLHRARAGAAVRGRRLADPPATSSSTGRTAATPASTISSPRCPRASARTSARNAPRRRTGVEIRHLTRRGHPPRALGRVLGVLPGHRRAQMGPALPDPRGVRPVRRADGRQHPAGAGLRRWPADRRRAQLHRRGRALRPLLGLQRVDKPFLHFELCYYQAIDAAIARGLARVEAGAQGGHKLARGYEPVQTTSAHWIADPGFREAVADFLEREREGVAVDAELARPGRTPFRKG